MNNRIRRLREEKHMTQVRLSIELEVSQETISAYEKGKHLPSLNSLIKMSQIFDASMDYIMGFCDVRMPAEKDNLPDDEALLISRYRQFDKIGKAKITAYIDGLCEK